MVGHEGGVQLRLSPNYNDRYRILDLESQEHRNVRIHCAKNIFLKHWAGGLVGRARGWGAAPAESKLHLRLFKLRPKKPLQPTCLIYFALYNMENTNTCTQK